MKGIGAFLRGGLDIPERHKRGDFESIDNAFIPATAIVPLSEGARVQTRCNVYPGQEVDECQIIGRSENPGSANVHSPIPGRVKELKNIRLPDGNASQAVVIELGGSFTRLGKKQELYPWKSLSASEIDHILVEKGVLNFTRRPEALHQTLVTAKKGGCPAIIVNAIDPEPYGLTEALLCDHRPADIAIGAEISMKACGAGRAVIAVPVASTKRGTALESAFEAQKTKYERVELAARYPSRFDREVKAAVKNQLSRKFASEDFDKAVILNPSTLIAIYEAVALNKAFVERTVTVLGEAIRSPSVLKARIGTRIGDLIEECGGFKSIPERIVVNGSMTGFAIGDLDLPVMKSTTSILALTSAEIRKSGRSACIRCARCVEVCPERLNPERLFRLIRSGRHAGEYRASLARCTLCGACGYACPSRVPLVDTFSSTLEGVDQGGGAHD